MRRQALRFPPHPRTDFPDTRGAASWPEQLGNELTLREVSCWWDRWNLPQADEGGADALRGELLQDLLDDAVQQAAWFLALIGPEYLRAGDGSWPRKEWIKAGSELDHLGRRHQMHRVAVFFSEPRRDAEHRRWVGAYADPADVAKAIARELD